MTRRCFPANTRAPVPFPGNRVDNTAALRHGSRVRPEVRGTMEALKLVQPEEVEALDLEAINARLADAGAEEIIAWAASTFGEGLLMSSSFGSHSALMLHLVTRVVPRIPVV